MFSSQYWHQGNFFCQPLFFEIRFQLCFQWDNCWYIISILDYLMTRNAPIGVARLIYQATTPVKSEKRRHFRLSLRLPMEYSFPESSHHCLACTVDICEGGLLMYAPEKLETGQVLRLKFYYDSASGLDWVQAYGEVIREGRFGNSGKEYWYAVKFVDLSSDILKKLREFLKSLY
jgi:hypothetical protein